jgi:hypothetical protein
MRLVFQQHKIPRSTTRQEWSEIWRWKRVTVKSLAEAEKSKFRGLHDLYVAQPAMREMAMRGMMEQVNPPIMIYPFDRAPSAGISPGSIWKA